MLPLHCIHFLLLLALKYASSRPKLPSPVNDSFLPNHPKNSRQIETGYRPYPSGNYFVLILSLLFKRKTYQFPQTQQSKSRKSPKIRKRKRKIKQFVILGVCFISMKVLEPRVSTGPFTKSSYANKPTVFFFSGASLQ